MSSFIADFMAYSAGTECHRNYLLWSAFTPVAIAAGKQFEFYQGRFLRTTELCTVLVGPSGGKKTSAKDIALEIVTDALPDIPIAADITSRDDLMHFMSSKDTCRFFINHEGAEGEWHPTALFIDEIRHFMSYSPSAMIAFLVAIYGRKHFKGSTLKRGVEDIEQPCLNLLGCTTEDWIVEHLKTGILAGGWSRRFIVVYEPEISKDCVPIPIHVDGWEKLKLSMKSHLERIRQKAGLFQWGPGAESMFISWYKENKKNLPPDTHLQAYFLTKDGHLLKICMLLDLACETPSLLITKQNLTQALAMFEVIEDSLPKLYLSAGRNELAVPQQKILDLIEKNNGWMAKKDVMARFDKELAPMEQMALFKHLESSGRIWIKMVEIAPGVRLETMMNAKGMIEVNKNNGRVMKLVTDNQQL